MTFLLLAWALCQDPNPPDPPRSPSAVTVITGDELRRTGVRSFSDALRLVPGFEVTRASSTEVAISARGYNDDSSTLQGILGLVDGRQVYNDFFGNVLWDALPVPIEAIERIDVIRGPGSFLYGPNAMHGIVNIVTKAPLDYDGDLLFLSGSAGSYRSDAGTLMFVRKLEDTAFKLTAAWDDIEQFDTRGDTRDKVMIEARYERAVGDNVFGLTGTASRQRLETLIPTFLGVPAATFSSEVTDLLMKLRWSNGPFEAYVAWDHFQADSAPDAIYAPFALLLDSVDLEGSATYDRIDQHLLTGGVGYRFSRFETDDIDISDGAHSTDLCWVYAQDRLSLGAVAVTGGARVDVHNIAGTVVSPRLAVVWEARPEELTLRASAGSGFREPSLREFWFQMPVNIPGFPAGLITGNRDLRPELMRSFELACYATPTKRVRAEASLFYNLTDRLVVYVPVTPLLIVPDNSKKNIAYGAEAEVRVLAIESCAAWLFANGSFSERIDRDTHDRLAFAPRWKGNAGVTVGDAGEIQAMLWVNFFDDVTFERGTVPEHTIVSARLSAPFEIDHMKGRAYVEAFNLLNRRHRETPDGEEFGMIFTAGAEIRW